MKGFLILAHGSRRIETKDMMEKMMIMIKKNMINKLRLLIIL